MKTTSTNNADPHPIRTERAERADPVDQIRDMIDEGAPDILARIADLLLTPEEQGLITSRQSSSNGQAILLPTLDEDDEVSFPGDGKLAVVHAERYWQLREIEERASEHPGTSLPAQAACTPGSAASIPAGLAKLLRSCRDDGMLSEGQITAALGVDRLTCREILDGVPVTSLPASPHAPSGVPVAEVGEEGSCAAPTTQQPGLRKDESGNAALNVLTVVRGVDETAFQQAWEHAAGSSNSHQADWLRDFIAMYLSVSESSGLAEQYSDMLREICFQHSAGGYNSLGLMQPEMAASKIRWIIEDTRRAALYGGAANVDTAHAGAAFGQNESPSLKWTRTPPVEQGEYWHWNGDVDCAPFPLSVMYSGTARKCFVALKDTHSGQAEWCDMYGGWWLRIQQPSLPDEAAEEACK